jgi:post-segregation antitoxin (ccd killing protein)
MAKVKVSVTVDPARLEQAKQLTGLTNMSEVLERGLAALIEDELERLHTDGYAEVPQAGETVAAVDPSVWAELPWDDE